MKICGVEGCYNKYVAKGWCKKHYSRWHRHGNTDIVDPAPMQKRFEEKYIPVTESGCWIWTAYCNQAGYGSIYDGKKDIRATRASWILHKGPISEGMCVLHKCDVPSCVNPDHLFLGTNADNSADMVAKGRSSKGEKNGNAKINEKTVLNIFNCDDKYHEIAKEHGVSITTVGYIKQGCYWSHVTGKSYVR